MAAATDRNIEPLDVVIGTAATRAELLEIVREHHIKMEIGTAHVEAETTGIWRIIRNCTNAYLRCPNIVYFDCDVTRKQLRDKSRMSLARGFDTTPGFEGLLRDVFGLGSIDLAKTHLITFVVVSRTYGYIVARPVAQDKGRGLPAHGPRDDAAKYTTDFAVYAGLCCTLCRTTAPPLKVCSRCKLARYCSETCQKRHWETSHKTDCATFLNLNLGKY